MFKKILIANRGEIAIRVIRACRDMGIRSVSVFSEADRNSLHVLLSDEAYPIGPAPSNESYLNVDKILSVAKRAGADAIHPGYGFLSENPNFVRRVEEEGLTFIGPKPESMEVMGDKISAKEQMKKSGVPIVPGSDGAIETVEELKKVAKEVGFPLLIKASSGGGGKGMRYVAEESQLESNYNMARSEAKKFFASDDVYIERFVQSPKHIEIQIFGDSHGNTIHLFERECSMQRRHQKVLEECPSPALDEESRRKMGEVAVKAARSINYLGAGTIEFIFDSITKEFFFMEMNTRLQVEHPVTEMCTGVDLVQEQIRVAAGLPLSVKQEDLKLNGHAIEARICAEDPATFAPSPGLIRRCRNPQGSFIRLDSSAFPGYEVPIYYDPMVAKLIVWGRNRDEAIQRMDRALAEFSLTGIKTNIVLHKSLIHEEAFRSGEYTTQFIDNDFSGSSDNLFKFVDDRVFLISLAVEAYKNLKPKSTADHNIYSRWKDIGRQEGQR
ncbi:MAG: acetyl-CoA carboxylase biotin carboxylase subunit [Bdellovibrionaceae bacterium]|nr:acetyl-CoA carboxylase biotin carboxylase subunit [Pseudobdellovibrionaceae bacterium]|tara:strand:- start:23532 stop:25025 length:1494 start_codon:yes stop_codon:yes gene_type:complete